MKKKIHWEKIWHKNWPPLLVLALILLIWECLVRAFGVSLVVLPPPSLIFSETASYFRSELLDDWMATIKILLMGYFTGVPTGILLASLISQSKLATKAFQPLITVLVTLPTMVIIPIFMVWVGYTVEYRAILVFLNVASIITLNTLSGFINVKQRYLELAQSYGASRRQTFFKFIFPNAMPEIFQGLRLGCTFSILNTIGIEMIAGKIGLGFSVQYFSGILKMPIVWGSILLVGITGRLMFSIVTFFERRIVNWNG